MTSDNKKQGAPQRFWIVTHFETGKTWVAITGSSARRAQEEGSIVTPVIEASAYEALKKERDEVQANYEGLKVGIKNERLQSESLKESLDKMQKRMEELEADNKRVKYFEDLHEKCHQQQLRIEKLESALSRISKTNPKLTDIIGYMMIGVAKKALNGG